MAKRKAGEGLDVKRRLHALKIEESRYEQERRDLIVKGYTEEQCDKLIMRKGSSKEVDPIGETTIPYYFI